MTTIDPRIDDSGFHIARAIAVQNYANVEGSMCILLSHLMGGPLVAAGTIFYRINSSRSRNLILGELLETKHGDAYRTYWRSMDKLLESIHQERNKIVHWHVALVINLRDNAQIQTSELTPPNYWARDQKRRTISLADLTTFSRKCDFVSRSLNMFCTFLMEQLPPEAKERYAPVFGQPVTYPPPADHPLAVKG
jgi:hypothetical protein